MGREGGRTDVQGEGTTGARYMFEVAKKWEEVVHVFVRRRKLLGARERAGKRALKAERLVRSVK